MNALKENKYAYCVSSLLIYLYTKTLALDTDSDPFCQQSNTMSYFNISNNKKKLDIKVENGGMKQQVGTPGHSL